MLPRGGHLVSDCPEGLRVGVWGSGSVQACCEPKGLPRNLGHLFFVDAKTGRGEKDEMIS